MERGIGLTLSRFSYFNPDSNFDAFNDSEGHHNGECFLRDFSEFHDGGINNPANFPTNCAYGIMITNQAFDYTQANNTAATDLTKLSLVCGDCLPGYKPIYGTTLTTLIF